MNHLAEHPAQKTLEELTAWFNCNNLQYSNITYGVNISVDVEGFTLIIQNENGYITLTLIRCGSQLYKCHNIQKMVEVISQEVHRKEDREC
jgi:hypothetical protein